MSADHTGAAFKLRAEDADDLAVISSCLQDALVAVRDLAFVQQDLTFLMVANRFRWERAPRSAPGETGYQRTLCGITFGDVTGVTYHGFRRNENERILSLLAIQPGRGRKGDAILLEFSEGARIRLEVSRILCRAQDLGEPWPTQWRPRHDVDERV